MKVFAMYEQQVQRTQAADCPDFTETDFQAAKDPGRIPSQQGPSQTFCRLFALATLTAIKEDRSSDNNDL